MCLHFKLGMKEDTHKQIQKHHSKDFKIKGQKERKMLISKLNDEDELMNNKIYNHAIEIFKEV